MSSEKKRYNVIKFLTKINRFVINIHIMNKKGRQPITIHIRQEAFDILTDMSKDLTKKAKKKRSVSPGKIVEALILRDDARTYTEEVFTNK
jgi:hypothetical protein